MQYSALISFLFSGAIGFFILPVTVSAQDWQFTPGPTVPSDAPKCAVCKPACAPNERAVTYCVCPSGFGCEVAHAPDPDSGSGGNCSGGQCKATCDINRNERANPACKSQCQGTAVYCTTSSSSAPTGGTAGGSQCSGQSVGGVCFPTGTGLSEASILQILTKVASWLLGIFGILALIAFVVSGLQYLLASGNEEIVETAKRHMKWSIVGVIVGLSGVIIIRVIENLLR